MPLADQFGATGGGPLPIHSAIAGRLPSISKTSTVTDELNRRSKEMFAKMAQAHAQTN